MMNITAAIGFAVMAAGLAACAMQEANEVDHGVAAIQFADIPVPEGLDLATHNHRSHSYEVGSFRYGDFLYRGSTNPDAAVDYMTDRMAIHGWELRDSRVGDSGTELVFWRRPYETTCRIWTEASTTAMSIAVRTHLTEQAAAGP